MQAILKDCYTNDDKFEQYKDLSKLYELEDYYTNEEYINIISNLYQLKEDVVTTDTLYYDMDTNKYELLVFKGYCTANYEENVMYPFEQIVGLVNNKNFIINGYEFISTDDYNINYKSKYINIVDSMGYKSYMLYKCKNIASETKSLKYVRKVLNKCLTKTKIAKDLESISDKDFKLVLK